MKILINILSEQVIPNFVATLHELPDKVIALTTPQFTTQPDLLEELTGTPHEQITFSAYDLAKNMQVLSSLLANIPEADKVILNFTGGTKVMSLSSVFSCIQMRRPLRMIYVDTAHKRLDVLIRDEKMRIVPEKAEALTLNIPFDAYIQLHGESLLNTVEELPVNEEKNKVARMLISADCDAFFHHQKEFFDKTGKDEYKIKGDFKFKSSHRTKTSGEGSCCWGPKGAILTLPDGKQNASLTTKDSVSFLAGGWLEEYCFNRLKQSGHFTEVLMNVKISLKPETIDKLKRYKNQYSDKNEIDVVVTHGLKAALIECKAGKVTQDHIYKLNALRKHLLGSFGCAVLVSRNPVQPQLLEKAADCDVRIIFGNMIKNIHIEIDKLLS